MDMRGSRMVHSADSLLKLVSELKRTAIFSGLASLTENVDRRIEIFSQQVEGTERMLERIGQEAAGSLKELEAHYYSSVGLFGWAIPGWDRGPIPMENPGVERIPAHATQARFYPGPPRCFPLVIGREIFSFFGGEEKILLTRRHNERGRCGGDGCTARCDSDVTATARSLLRQLTPPVATFFPVSSFPSH
uniref:Uncharacterized protein n=1 Tax=Oryza barthii TaxID=65489 RepID=A0A0D3H1E9_9ORYZ